MNYPNGNKKKATHASSSNNQKQSFSNRGMRLEDDINQTNAYYLAKDIAVIHKKPTPVQIVNVDYPKRSAAVIKEAYFKQASTTDYNGIYKGHYIDFEAKETKNKHSFPLNNFHDHQIEHLKSVDDHGGIGFIVVRFNQLDRTFYLPAMKLFSCWERQYKDGGRKSIPLHVFENEGIEVPVGYPAIVDYISVIDQLFFK
ncbi:recombination protein U [Pelagirhabdus alkalitolerans]|uniref:Holliday junction resolvase RecU n=1 Tax=Pelagirhabdus alkalitolerans TaxID=1612202 RepID=A0A1G6HC10_9BACI|nr:Holliday junction resolvase RecU [Pelagirhabdus alkalitolerans]SDB90976.1 recombination protein U [Pelagirhabdus alkalitolerans]